MDLLALSVSDFDTVVEEGASLDLFPVLCERRLDNCLKQLEVDQMCIGGNVQERLWPNTPFPFVHSLR